MSLGIALGPHNTLPRDVAPRVDRSRAVAMGDTDLSAMFAFEMERDSAACANVGFGPVILAAIALWGLIGLSINWALHI